MSTTNSKLEEWFESIYSQLYYQNKDIIEAEKLIMNLLPILNYKETDTALDMCCGNGRHSFILERLGLIVTGVDSSKRQIDVARKFESNKMKFIHSDIIDFTSADMFDFIFNLCSSFGYATEEFNIKILNKVADLLNTGGKFVLDYWNCSHPEFECMIENRTQATKVKNINGVHFMATAFIDNNYYFKNIEVHDGDKTLAFQEKMMLIPLNQFLIYFERCGLKVVNVFGDYDLSEFKPSSERIIFVVEK